MMLEKFFLDPKRAVLVVGAVVVMAFVCFTLFAAAGWFAFRTEETPEPTVVPVSINYCGEKLTDLCVVSFSRDVFGNTIINLYVPIQRHPIFYLNIIRQSGESRFECEWEKKIRTSVHCEGSAINLGEGFKMQVVSVKEDRLIAQGDFTLTAYLVTTQTADGEPPASDTPEPVSTEDAISTLTETPVSDLPSATEISTEIATELPEITETPDP